MVRAVSYNDGVVMSVCDKCNSASLVSIKDYISDNCVLEVTLECCDDIEYMRLLFCNDDSQASQLLGKFMSLRKD